MAAKANYTQMPYQGPPPPPGMNVPPPYAPVDPPPAYTAGEGIFYLFIIIFVLHVEY